MVICTPGALTATEADGQCRMSATQAADNETPELRALLDVVAVLAEQIRLGVHSANSRLGTNNPIEHQEPQVYDNRSGADGCPYLPALEDVRLELLHAQDEVAKLLKRL